jgi:hypothetical protein
MQHYATYIANVRAALLRMRGPAPRAARPDLPQYMSCPLKDRAVTETTARKFGEKGAAQAKDTYQKVTVATQEAANVFQNAYSTATQAAQDYNAKVLEFALAYTNAALAYTQELWGVKSPSEFMELSVKHASEQFKMVTNQTKEFAALAQRMPLKTAEPLKVAWA